MSDTTIHDVASTPTTIDLSDRNTRQRIRDLMKHADPGAYYAYQHVKYPSGRASKTSDTVTAANQVLADWISKPLFIVTNVVAVLPEPQGFDDVDEEDDS